MIIKDVISISKSETIKDLSNKIEKFKLNNIYPIAIYFEKKIPKGILTLGNLRRLIKSKSESLAIKHLNTNPVIINDELLNNNLQSFINLEIKKRKIKSINEILLVNKKKEFLGIMILSEIEENFNFKSTTVVGLGHVGLPLLVSLSKKNSKINGFDIDKKKIKNLNKGKINFLEENLTNNLKNELKKKKINLFHNINEINSQIIIVCLGHELYKKKINDKKLYTLTKSLSKIIKVNDIIILRGTVKVGYTRNTFVKILEKFSNFKCGKDFFVGYMPERLLEGNALNEIEEIPQIISGYTKNCLEKINKYSVSQFNKTISASSIEEAEIIKLASNSYRDLNFAFSNEISRIADNNNLLGSELIKKANFGYKRNHIAKPSIGVGGSCLPKDPIIFSSSTNKNKGYIFSKLSRYSNDNSIRRAVNKIQRFKNKFFKNHKLKILILGIAFKGTPETIDTRNSPGLEIYNMLKVKNQVYMYDVNSTYIKKQNKNLRITKDLRLNKYDLILAINDHPEYKKLIYRKISKNNSNSKKMVFDPWRLVDKQYCLNNNWIYESV